LGKGFAVAGINYRLSKHAPFPAQLHDCKAAVRFLRSNAKKYDLDPDRFGAWGASAGGHLVALLGTTGDVKELEGDVGTKDGSSRVQCVCNWFGPTDLIRLSPPPAKNNPVTRLLGGTTGEKKDLAVKGNPITHCTKDDAPCLILHGDKDTLVPVSQSELFHDALKKVGDESTLIVVAGAGHSGAVAGNGNSEKIAAFFEKHLKAR
jgi:acetyl esterase/lipase